MRAAITLILILALGAPVHAQPAPSWHTYRNPHFGYSIDVPAGFTTAAGAHGSDGIALSAVTGKARIQIYGGHNAKAADPEKLAAVLAGSDRVKRVTYRAGGRDWLVLSGYYQGAGTDGGNVVFYTKFMFNRDHSALSAFEISYPAAEKPRYDAVVAHLEKTLTPPR